MSSFHGVWPALVTPFTRDDQVSVKVLKDLTDHFIDLEVDGFYVCGSTGQGLFMSLEERKLVAETVIEQVGGRVPVVIHVGSPVLRDAKVLARHAQDTGASGISSVVPAYFDELEAVLQYYKALAESAPNIPLWPYFWSQTNNRLGLIKKLIEIPTVTAMKYTGPNMYEMRNIIGLRNDNWTVFSGMDEQSVFARMFGARGCIGTTINLFPGAYKKIYRHLSAGNSPAAIDIQNQLNWVIRTMYTYSFRGALVEMLRAQGLDCGQPRLPHLPLTEDEREKLWGELVMTSYQELIAM
jgi:N-acetylneuraminate lyase